MNSQYFQTVILCIGVGLAPVDLVASELKANPKTQVQTAETQVQTLRERRLRRMLQYHQRRAALQHVSSFVERNAPYRRFTLTEIREHYEAKGAALTKVVRSAKLRKDTLAHAKARALAEVKAIAAVMRSRVEAEQRAMASTIRQMKSENPNYAEDALRLAAETAEKNPGEVITQTEGLPILSKTVDMDYLDTLKRTPKLVPSKIVSEPVMPTRTTNPTAELANPGNVPSFLVQPYSQEQLLDLAQRQAMTAYKKEQALNKVKEAQRRAEVQQSTSSISEKRRKLKELLALYAGDKISPKEYYERRALIMGTEPADQ